jgi:hypothetical protein
MLSALQYIMSDGKFFLIKAMSMGVSDKNNFSQHGLLRKVPCTKCNQTINQWNL